MAGMPEVPILHQTLLVVDDRKDNLLAMEALLGNDEWRVRTADSGDAALQCLLDEQVGLVLLDVQMPGMDGYEVARLMRGNSRTRHIPIIFLTASAYSEGAVLRGYAHGAVDYILKPFDPQVLRHKVQTLLEHARNCQELLLVNQMLESERAFSGSVLENAAEGILVVDQNGWISFANPALARMLNASLTDLLGHSLLKLLDGEPDGDWRDSEFYQHWQRGSTYRRSDISLRTCSGASVPVALSCSPLLTPQPSMVVIVRDMSVESDLQARLASQAVTDALTGLLNRRGLQQRLKSALARGADDDRRIALLYLDLDGFKRINDSLGHRAGDAVLVHVANLLKTELRPYDALARVGGDEFIALLDSLDHPEDAARVAEKLIERVSVRHQFAGSEITLGGSVGIASYPECGQSVHGLMRAADMAMYEAKAAGRGQYRFFTSEMNDRARSRLTLEENLRLATEQQDFELKYQPQIHLNSGRLRGFEALLRWEHEITGPVRPDVFIPLLEETRLINPVGEWIFNEGLGQLGRWNQREGTQLILSINVSAVQFGMPQLVDQLRRSLELRQIAPSQLEVEVTESALMQNLETTREQLSQLRALGVRIAIDDFGTGYSSLAYLRHFEIDTLKIDRLFISNMLSSPKDAAVVETIIDLSRNLGLEVIAEGVETLAERDWLVAHGCDFMQGFLVAPALAADRAQAFPATVDWSDPGRC